MWSPFADGGITGIVLLAWLEVRWDTRESDVSSLAPRVISGSII